MIPYIAYMDPMGFAEGPKRSGPAVLKKTDPTWLDCHGLPMFFTQRFREVGSQFL